MQIPARTPVSTADVPAASPEASVAGPMPPAFGPAALVLLTLLAGFSAYFQLYSGFRPYDDEGYLLISSLHFIQGRALYDEVHALYGPFFYLAQLGLYGSGVLSLDHETARLIALAVWLACSLAPALLVYRLSGSLPAAALTQFLSFHHWTTLTNEPEHPQGLAALLIVVLPLLWAHGASRWRPLACGMVLGCLLLTKINIGGLALLAVAHTFIMELSGRAGAWLRSLAGLVLLLAPLLLLHGVSAEPWGRYYALAVVLGLVPVVSGPLPAERTSAVKWPELAPVAGGCLLTLGLGAGVLLARGTTPSGLFWGTIAQHLQMPFRMAARLELGDMLVGVIGFAGWLLYRWQSRGAEAQSRGAVLIVVLKAALAASVFWQETRPDVAPLLARAVPFLWLALVEPATAAERGAARARRLLVTLAVLQSLAAFPTAGSQRWSATFLMVPIAVLCLVDVLAAVAAPRVAQGRLGWLTLALLAALHSVDAARARSVYAQLYPLDLPGARRLRVPEDHVALYQWLCANLRRHADTFYSQPGFNSLYFWTQQRPPTLANTTHWMTSLGPAEQQAIVAALKRSPRPCAVVSGPWTDFWQAGRPLEQGPLVVYLRDEFRTAGSVSSFQFLTRKDNAPPELVWCVQRLEGFLPGTADPACRCRLVLPAETGQRIRHLALVSQPAGIVVADTMPDSGIARLEVRDRADAQEPLADLANAGAAAAAPRTLWLRFPWPANLDHNSSLVLRLYDAHAGWLGSVPFLE